MSELDLTRLTIEDLWMVLAKSGGHVSREQLEEDFKDGAPRNEDGTVNFLHYGAWLFAQI